MSLHSTSVTNGSTISEAPALKPKAMTSSNSALLARSVHQPALPVEKASGNYLHLATGERIFDATGGAAVACLGHGDARVTYAVYQQMMKVSYCHSRTFVSSPTQQLAELLVDSTNGLMAKALFTSSGSEVMELSMKLARQYHLEKLNPEPQRTKFITLRNSYHGNTIGALSLSGHLGRRKIYEPLLNPNVSHVSDYGSFRQKQSGESTDDFIARLTQEVEQAFQTAGQDKVCAFGAETVMGASAAIVLPPEGYLRAVRNICDKYGALLILDEVMCGIGRTGSMHAWQQEGIVPDIQAIGNALGGGYMPIAGILIGHQVVKALYDGTGSFSNGQTYQGHAVACAAALEVQRIIQRQNLVANCKGMGDLLLTLLRQKLQDHPNVGDIRGRGLFLAVSIFWAC